ncbi:PREDICTED: uncharacterized protein LOC106101106 [Papilio polytes]|uniref:uncharacterized protein LOC106101106 n=1 Tax=Papilio polytes TaxID=76194 RepID=UPI0006761AA9|nr:PREDICTED: uncharacterized protein LOC106101106 [Papilio polytes]
MCRTIQSLIQTFICAIQMVTRIFMTVLLMIENMIRMLLQSIYNFISTILQIVSLIPICCVFMLTAKMRCLLCGGGGGGCGGGGGGFASCFVSAIFLIFLFKALRSYGLADKLLLRLGYTRAWKYEGKAFTQPPSPTMPPTTVNGTNTTTALGGSGGSGKVAIGTKRWRPGGRIGFDPFDDDIKNYVFDDFESSTTSIKISKTADPNTATEYSKVANLSSLLHYIF